MWLSMNMLQNWQKYPLYLFLLTLLAGCAIPVNKNYPTQSDRLEKARRELESSPPYYGSARYGSDRCCEQMTQEEIWAEQRAYDAERRAREAERRAREAEQRNNQPPVNTSRQCTPQNPCKQFKAPR